MPELLSLFEYSWVFPENVVDCLRQWSGRGLSKRGKILWQSAAHAIFWSIWEERINRVFNNRTKNFEELISLICYICFLWASSSSHFRGVLFDDLQRNAVNFLHSKQIQFNTTCNFRSDVEGETTLYFDGSAFGNPGTAGIGGVIRNRNGISWAFSGLIGIASSTKAEVLAALTGIRIAKDMGLRSLTIKGDSANTINWLSSPDSGPWALAHYLAEARDILASLSGQVVWIPR
ncbi:PREDICTED: uncharacterized protein LOC104604082 [Nelumbo nucifera]|uniref:Uncharacterized protein LOC104604082 n=1 Tax=Nelumbo nucifera TaxID=4432 RepID=A0A1U8AHK1_NELNU|nr:PREDICTED: uncharacterized protein LOC104604082 [Nelumbo nucifera]